MLTRARISPCTDTSLIICIRGHRPTKTAEINAAGSGGRAYSDTANVKVASRARTRNAKCSEGPGQSEHRASSVATKIFTVNKVSTLSPRLQVHPCGALLLPSKTDLVDGFRARNGRRILSLRLLDASHEERSDTLETLLRKNAGERQSRKQ